ncbi:MAG TPA: thioesterase family protein [Gemmatimonadaceae bacterium]|jgi:YbgC/YbaW family acyl-CoA thioester hydrolase|nr:thioesterase family protein [Gemmatimonadaceae bacterium]
MPEALPEAVFHIYPTDCDMLGHLNHGTMLHFLERARWALLEPQINYDEVGRQPVFVVVRRVEIDYRAQVLPGEDLVIRSGLLMVKTTSFIVRQEARIARTGVLAAEANLVIVTIDRSGRPVPVPESWSGMFPRWPDAPVAG